jgi:pSer/pThr/pTyr-binding forkhead associated (FHA) protein/uncharacterized protein involved in exopolysaccharide biosynthesis
MVIVGGPETGRLLTLGTNELVLGRADDLSGRLTDPSISQRHAKVIWHDGRHVLIDLGSTNGTFVNDKRIDGPHQLSHRDSVRVGQTQLKFLAGANAERGGTETVRIDLPDPKQARQEKQERRRDLVRYRDSRLAQPGSRELQSHPSRVPSSTPDWVFYVRNANDYAKRYGLFVALMTAVGLSAGSAHALLRPPLGSAFFEITLSREAKANPVEEEQSVQYFVAAEKSFTSVPLIKETLKRLGMEPTDGVALSIQQSLTFTNVTQSERVWRGDYTARTASDAETLLSKHLEVYLEREVDKNLRLLRAEIALLQEQLERSGKTLRETEAELAAFKQAHPGVVTSDGVSDQYASLDTLQGRRDELSAQVQRLQLELNLNKKRLTSGDALLAGRVASASSYTTSLQDIEKQIGEAKAEGLGEEHPKIKKLRAQAKELGTLRDSTIHAESSDIDRRSNESYVAVRERVKDLEVALSVAQTELGQVSTRLKNTSTKVDDLPTAEANLSKLTRNYASTKSLHDRLYQKLQASQIQLQMEQASTRARFDIVTPPTEVPPNMTMAVVQRGGVGAFALMMLAIAFAVVRELVRYVRSVL